MNLQTEVILLCMIGLIADSFCNLILKSPDLRPTLLCSEHSNSLFPISNANPLRSSGIEDNPTIFYRLIRGSTDQTNKYDTFYLQQRHHNGWTYADIKVNSPLDYERIKASLATHRISYC